MYWYTPSPPKQNIVPQGCPYKLFKEDSTTTPTLKNNITPTVVGVYRD